MTVPVSLVAASIVPFDPTAGVAVVASVMLTVFIAAMTFLALAPAVSEKWGDQLIGTGQGGPSLDTGIETNESD
ncbi:hypothetical protein [Halobiforma nitratireducens]|uniref:Uncharacterized protein n=1 Tax=Halobiforma nitratireducens JCM 10879 TaxID=1227454 RepID=M0LF56_9EURY|nr:hypothetical protein [Halobiforma nitratireducens]EMA31049.1 hypothetical protein C446_15955 [Halobiforma nitratireducens JCM 10879]